MKLFMYYFSLFDFVPDKVNNAEKLYYTHNCSLFYADVSLYIIL